MQRLIIGAASPLGATLIDHLARTTRDAIIAMDHSSRLAELRGFTGQYGAERIDIAVAEPGAGLDGLTPETKEALRDNTSVIYNLSFDTNRRRPGGQLAKANEAAVRFAISLGQQARRLESLVSLTDVGLAGDYPGRFYESWLDVSQHPLDEVDAASLSAEKALLESDLPVVRARVGLLSDPDPELFSSEHWPSAAEVLVPTLKVLRRLPRMLSIPTIVDKASLAPLSPLPWTARSLAALGQLPQAVGKAVHLVLGEPIPMEEVLSELHLAVGGARVKGGVPVELLDILSDMPGINEAVRRSIDQLSSFWTPHRYCLSRNDLDTSVASGLLSKLEAEPRWTDARLLFFRHLR